MSKLITIPQDLLEEVLPFLQNSPLQTKIKELLENTSKYQTQDINNFPKTANVERVIDGDTIVLHSGTIVRYVGITSPENHEPFDPEAAEFNRKLVEGKTVQLEYDSYKADKFGRLLAYVIINRKNVSIELTKRGLAQAVIYQKRRPFIYQDQILKAQESAKKKKLGIWSNLAKWI